MEYGVKGGNLRYPKWWRLPYTHERLGKDMPSVCTCTVWTNGMARLTLKTEHSTAKGTSIPKYLSKPIYGPCIMGKF